MLKTLATVSFIITVQVEYKCSSASCELCGQNSLILQVFFALGNPHKKFCCTGKTKFYSTIKCFDKNEKKKRKN